MKRIIASTAVLFCLLSLSAQKKLYQAELNIDLGITDFGDIFNYKQLNGLYTVNLEYKPLSFLGVGGQLSYGGYKHYGGSFIVSDVLAYGVFTKIYLTSLLSRIEDPKFTLYLKGKVGGLNIYPRVDEYERSNCFEYGAYVGFRYAPVKRFAVYAELGYANYSFSQAGVSINLSK